MINEYIVRLGIMFIFKKDYFRGENGLGYYLNIKLIFLF